MELEKNHPELKSRPYSAPVVDVAFRPNANTERDRFFGNPMSVFDTSTHTPMHEKSYDQKNFNASISEQRQTKPDKLYRCVEGVKLHEHYLKCNTMAISPERENTKTKSRCK